ncbi:oligomeric Golgi complex subunit 4-like [Planoprotostelium fungivorum]|uniref:Conserved oligomeric Golgi complex subunit 4 n=1 Tax=Planoprotostelium fungivorum TaxID=1890364 RepID=A0A2P6NSX8_9EUKA|nr:oligomeric Golgi complex subunit 4-like [Planoprotostelium fungivorum]
MTLNTRLSMRSSADRSYLPSLDEISAVTELDSIESLLKEVVARERLLEQELNTFLEESRNDEVKLDVFEVLPGKLVPILKETRRLTGTIETSCNLAENISRKVKDLDAVRGRVGNVTKRVNDILDVKNCIEGVQRAMEKEDYEEAASYIQRFLNIDPSVFEGSSSAEQLRIAETRLKEIAHRKLEEAIRADNNEEILRYCSLYTPLGEREEGVTRYAHYLRNQANKESDAIYKHLARSLGHTHVAQSEDEKPISCQEAITSLFEGVADLIESQTELVTERFGPAAMVTITRHLQAQTDIPSTKIVDLFMETFHISRLHDEIMSQKKRTDGQVKDARDVAPILEEVVLMSQSAELFDQFLRRKAKDANDLQAAVDAENSEESTEPKSNQVKKKTDGLLHVSELNRRMQEIIGFYMLLEEYFMSESVKKAIRLDSVVEDSLCSSAVDRMFFVFQKATQRALLSANLNAVCATINIVISILDRDVKEYLQTLNTKSTNGTLLNNTEESSEYVLKLRKELEMGCQQTFRSLDVKVKSCLDELTESSNNLKKILSKNMDEAASHVMPKVRTFLEAFSGLGYELSEHEFTDREINDPFVQQLIQGVSTVVKPFKATLSSSNFDNFVHHIIRFACTRMEQELMRKRFNQLGGLQFDKELRVLQSFFSSITQKSVRDKFARLTQMAFLLHMEKESDVLGYWGQNSSNMTWRLTPSEVRKVLSLRSDFSREAIAKLKL